MSNHARSLNLNLNLKPMYVGIRMMELKGHCSVMLAPASACIDQHQSRARQGKLKGSIRCLLSLVAVPVPVPVHQSQGTLRQYQALAFNWLLCACIKMCCFLFVLFCFLPAARPPA